MTVLDVARGTLALLLIIAAVENHAGECEDANFDTWVVGKALQQGIKKEDLVEFARTSPEITLPRFERIKALVNDAYQYTADSANAWYEEHIKICEDES